MLQIPEEQLEGTPSDHLLALQAQVDSLPNYIERVAEANRMWDAKTNTMAGKSAFEAIRGKLMRMCFGAVRCAYCNDSAADEIDHVLPKKFFPDKAFTWPNYVYACGACNGSYKRDRYAFIDQLGSLTEVVRRRKDPVKPAPSGRHALIDPRTENPLDFLQMDLGTQLAGEAFVRGSFLIEPRDDLNGINLLRAKYTIETLGLERKVLCDGRKSAFGSFAARLVHFAAEKRAKSQQSHLDYLRDELLAMNHPMVFLEMQRQQMAIPYLSSLFTPIPEALEWRFC